MKRKKQWFLIYIKDKKTIAFKRIFDLSDYVNKSTTFVLDSIRKKIIRKDAIGEYVIANSIDTDLSAYHKKIKKCWYVHNLSDNSVDTYKSIFKLMKDKEIPISLFSRIHSYRWIYRGYAINRSPQIEWNKYTQIDADNPPIEEESKKLSAFFDQQDFYARVQRGIPCFDSITGINEKKLKRYKNNYRLSDEEAKEQKLQQVFPSSNFYLDPTKHLYIKRDNGFFYQLMYN